MTTREHEPETDSQELAQERELNQRRYEELLGLLEGKTWVSIETETHNITIEPEEVCVKEGGCLDVAITPLNSNGRDILTFDYHINHFDGVVEVVVDEPIDAERFDIPGGGGVYVYGLNKIEKEKFDSDPDYGKLAKFIIDQAAVGKKTFPEPTPPQPKIAI